MPNLVCASQDIHTSFDVHLYLINSELCFLINQSFEPQQLLLYTRQKVNPDLSTKKSDDEDEEEEEVEEEIASLAKTNNEDSDESSDEKEEEPKKSAGQVLSPAKKNNKATKESSSDESSDDESQSTKQVSWVLFEWKNSFLCRLPVWKQARRNQGGQKSGKPEIVRGIDMSLQ